MKGSLVPSATGNIFEGGKYNESLKNLKEVIELNRKCEAAYYAMGK